MNEQIDGVRENSISRRNLRLAEMKSRQNITVSEPTCLALR